MAFWFTHVNSLSWYVSGQTGNHIFKLLEMGVYNNNRLIWCCLSIKQQDSKCTSQASKKFFPPLLKEWVYFDWPNQSPDLNSEVHGNYRVGYY